MLAQDGGMATADGRHIERNLAIGTAANDGPIALDFESRARTIAFDKLENSHAN